MVSVVPVHTRHDLRRFVNLSFEIYKNDPNWVPPLRRDLIKMLTPGRHPFLEHATIQPFLAKTNGKTVGRIVAIENRAHNQFHKDDVGFVGLFECINDKAVSNALFDEATRWLLKRNLHTVRGPVNLSTNDSCGLFVEGKPGPPLFMMAYNPPYYEHLFEAAKFHKAKDLLAMYHNDKTVPARYLKSADKIEKRYGVRIRKVNLKDFDAEVERIFDLYNRCWEKNWGFVPMTEKEMEFLAKELRHGVDPDLVLILESEQDQKPLGFAFAIPDLNIAIGKAKGRLFPFGLVKILWSMKKIKRLRLMALGIRNDIRKKGLDSLMYLRLYQNAVDKGYEEAEFSWVLEDNLPTINPMERIGARKYRTYRIYERTTG